MLSCTFDPLVPLPPKKPDLLQQQKNKPHYDCLHGSAASTAYGDLEKTLNPACLEVAGSAPLSHGGRAMRRLQSFHQIPFKALSKKFPSVSDILLPCSPSNNI